MELLSPKNNDTETQVSLVSEANIKHFKHREPNDASTVSIFTFVALKNPMIFQIFENLYILLLGLLIKLNWNVDRVIWVLRIAKFYLFGHSRERCQVHRRRFAIKIIVALVAGLTFCDLQVLENSPHQQSFRN